MTALFVLGLLAGTASASDQIASSNDSETELVYVGSQERHIHALRLDTSTGTLTNIGTVADNLRPTWVEAHPQRPVLYAVDDDNAKEGSVTAYAVDRASGALTKMGAVATKGIGTTNLHVDIASMTLLAANYVSGSVSSIQIDDDGNLMSLASTITETGSGPNRRQASAHAHNAVIDPSGRYALVPDFGADRVFVYRFDRTTRALSSDDAAHTFIASPGSGPRHIVFGASGRLAYLITELSAQVLVLRWDATQGRLSLVQSLPITSAEFQGVKSGAEIAASRDGRFVYVENRAENALLVYRVDAESGELSEMQRVSSSGSKPWGFAIDASGKWMIVANQQSGTVNVFRIDPASGMLSDTGQSADIASPVSIAFVR
ncbi:lactonase family protein [Caballeronia novacaledonica]|uniref:lactonase family protein n=1 Tax=Caballeronia novacaledonica TaxID=1544861 RepID=UPI001FED15CA|nr:lactonase family protein [Caballeronia novacaledonica]